MRKFLGSRFVPLQNRDTRGNPLQTSSQRSSFGAQEPATPWSPKPAPTPGQPPQWQLATAESAATQMSDRYSTRPKPPPPAGPPPPLRSNRHSELESPQRTLTLSPRHSEAPAPTATGDPTGRPPPPKGSGALPAGWSVARDPEGYPYYYNLSTGENTYDRPGGVPPPPPPKAKPPPPPADMVEGRASSSAAPVAESSAAPVADPAEEEAAAALWGRCGLSVAEPTAASSYEQGDYPAAAPEPEPTFEPPLLVPPPDEGRPISPPALRHGAPSTFILLGKMVRSARSLVARPDGDEDAEGQRVVRERAARKESLRAADHLEADAYKDATRSRPSRQFRRRKVKASEAVLEGHGCGGAASPPSTSASCSPAAMDSPLPAAPKRGARRSSLGATLAGARARVRGSVHGMRRSIAGAPTGTAERNELKLATREMRENAF